MYICFLFSFPLFMCIVLLHTVVRHARTHPTAVVRVGVVAHRQYFVLLRGFACVRGHRVDVFWKRDATTNASERVVGCCTTHHRCHYLSTSLRQLLCTGVCDVDVLTCGASGTHLVEPELDAVEYLPVCCVGNVLEVVLTATCHEDVLGGGVVVHVAVDGIVYTHHHAGV